MTKRLVAVLFHAPGLRVLYGRRLSRFELIVNLAAIAATIVAMAACHSHFGLRGALAAFAAGHLAWGLYLATRV